MRRLVLKYVRGRGFDLYDVDPERPVDARKLIAEGVSVTTLAAFLVDASHTLGRWAGRNVSPTVDAARLLLSAARKVA